MDDQEFKKRADESLTCALQASWRPPPMTPNSRPISTRARWPSSSRIRPAKFVISPNAPVRQIWVSAHSKSYKLDWDSVENAFRLAGTGQTLTELIQEAIAKQLGEEVSL